MLWRNDALKVARKRYIYFLIAIQKLNLSVQCYLQLFSGDSVACVAKACGRVWLKEGAVMP